MSKWRAASVCELQSAKPHAPNRNQDEVEQLKGELTAEDTLAVGYAEATEHSGHVIDAVQQTLLDLILKLQEVDEIIEGAAGGRRTSEETDEVDFELADLLSGNVDDVQLLRVSGVLVGVHTDAVWESLTENINYALLFGFPAKTNG